MRKIITTFLLISTFICAKEVETGKLIYTVPDNIKVIKENDSVHFIKNKSGLHISKCPPIPLKLTPTFILETIKLNLKEEYAKYGFKVTKEEIKNIEIGIFEGLELSWLAKIKENNQPVLNKVYFLTVKNKKYSVSSRTNIKHPIAYLVISNGYPGTKNDGLDVQEILQSCRLK